MKKVVVEWPTSEKSKAYKAVQIELNDELYLIFGDANQFYHSDILGNFLQVKNIQYDEIEVKEKKIPAPKASSYLVRGMGYATIEIGTKEAFFSRLPSADYDIGIDGEFLDIVRENYPDWVID